MPYDDRCPVSVGCRRPNDQHQLSDSDREVLVLHSVLCLLRDSPSEGILAVLVFYLKPIQDEYAHAG